MPQLKQEQKACLYELIKSLEESSLNEVETTELACLEEENTGLNIYAENISCLSQSEAKEQNPKKLFLNNLKLVLEIVRGKATNVYALDLIEFGNNLLRELAYKYKGKNFTKFAKKEIEQKIDEKLKEAHYYFKASCFVCLLLTALGSQVKASENLDPSFKLSKPNYISQENWHQLQIQITGVSTKYKVPEAEIYSQIATNTGFNSKQKLTNNLVKLEEKLKETNKAASIIQRELNESLSGLYSNQDFWKYKIPSFINEIQGDIHNIEISFPNQASNGRLTAQVSFEGQNGRSIIAVPIKVQASNDFEVAQND